MVRSHPIWTSVILEIHQLSDDWSSNGVIIWDPVNKIVGAGTIVMDLSVVELI